jgi:hypothetical protein
MGVFDMMQRTGAGRTSSAEKRTIAMPLYLKRKIGEGRILERWTKGNIFAPLLIDKDKKNHDHDFKVEPWERREKSH